MEKLLRIYARGTENPRPTQNLLQRVFICPAHVMRNGAFPGATITTITPQKFMFPSSVRSKGAGDFIASDGKVAD
jgi:hypothetical protein